VTRDQANRILDAVRDGVPHNERLITAALCETGDLDASHVVTCWVEEWKALRAPSEEMAA
jgi:hypothetical protein